MNTEQLLSDIRERLVRIEERAYARDQRLEKVETMVAALERFRWWIMGGLGVSGAVGGAVAQHVDQIMR
jgi:hypothetical protein